MWIRPTHPANTRRWADVVLCVVGSRIVDDGPNLIHHWFNVSCYVGILFTWLQLVFILSLKAPVLNPSIYAFIFYCLLFYAHAYALSPSHHHLYIIHLINWPQRFYCIIMSLKIPFVPKSDVKQWFTTTTTTIIFFYKNNGMVCV